MKPSLYFGVDLFALHKKARFSEIVWDRMESIADSADQAGLRWTGPSICHRFDSRPFEYRDSLWAV